MHPVDALARLGGVAPRAHLLGLVGRQDLERALASGLVVRDRRGTYALPTAPAALRAAAAHSGVVSHQSAAAAWGWELKVQPDRPHLTVPRRRTVDEVQRNRFVPHWADLRPDEVHERVTSPERTLADCLRTMPPDEALCVADAALRHAVLDATGLCLLAASLTGPGSGAARRVAAMADGRAANPFESTLRWIASGVRGLDLVPQVTIDVDGFRARPDLVDERRRIVVEADSATWHTSRQALRRDCRRHTRLALLGWLVLRFAWEDVMHEPDYVRAELVAAARAQPRTRRRSDA